jgi:LysM repeat protein
MFNSLIRVIYNKNNFKIIITPDKELYQLNTDQLMKLNQLESTTLVLGQKLIINKEDEINIDSSTNYENKTHLVAAGDTLFNISKRYNLTLEQLKQLNNLTDNNISLGQILKIK